MSEETIALPAKLEAVFNSETVKFRLGLQAVETFLSLVPENEFERVQVAQSGSFIEAAQRVAEAYRIALQESLEAIEHDRRLFKEVYLLRAKVGPDNEAAPDILRFLNSLEDVSGVPLTVAIEN